ESRIWRALPAHDRHGQVEPEEHQDRDLDRRRLPIARRRQVMACDEQGREGILPAESGSGGRAMCAQDRTASEAERSFLPAEPSWRLSQPGRRAHLAGDRERPAVEFWFWPDRFAKRIGIYRPTQG